MSCDPTHLDGGGYVRVDLLPALAGYLLQGGGEVLGNVLLSVGEREGVRERGRERLTYKRPPVGAEGTATAVQLSGCLAFFPPPPRLLSLHLNRSLRRLLARSSPPVPSDTVPRAPYFDFPASFDISIFLGEQKHFLINRASFTRNFSEMVFTLGTLFEALLLLVNAIAILNEERFLAKGECTVVSYLSSILEVTCFTCVSMLCVCVCVSMLCCVCV